MFPYKKELRYYEISPKFVPAHKSARITIRPLGKHARFPARVSVFFLPLEETTERWSPSMSGSGAAHADMAADAEQYARIEAEPSLPLAMNRSGSCASSTATMSAVRTNS